MRSMIVISVIASLLFGSVEGMAEPVDDSTFHQAHHVHADDVDQWYHDNDGDDHDGEACEHFCHVHVVALTPDISAPTLQGYKSYPLVSNVGSFSRSAAPPTPPPNI
jgi:hypothetical protein